ncbi:DNA-binding MurR/RpiR family transcriptional regulator [Sporomusaceae bacterium BoRhaA]|uniref:MurR/RpiR family transcriptional regulator n=1 Tax=Pelorhabdus rhamnosifermentans TaxID=2772457 RepID=UPI001C06292A|nr:MurR/RpiR family transcriptional regulator [Pelorhabdus rhamnosifermentans]MBU2700135.1 DNA-binding MurR/RpiR family transcriptional regulator [Pelorhabdus rhamnosifermentans]
MRNYNDLYLKLQKIINQSASNDPYKIIAKTLIENIDSFEHITIEKMAILSFTSTSTISRFVRSLGYKSFIDLKEYSKSNKVSRFISMNDNLKDLKFDKFHDNDILKNYIDTICNSLQNLKENIDLKKIDKINEMIYSNEHISIYGILLPGSLAKQYQLTMLSLGKYCEYYDLLNLDLSLTSEKSRLSLFFSVDGNFIESSREIIVKAKAKGEKLILVTQNPRIRLSNMFDEILYMGSCDSPKSGRYKLMLFIEILLNRYYITYYNDLM